MDTCPSIILSQTISDLLGTVDVHQQIMKAQADMISTNDLVTSLCVCVCVCVRVCVCVLVGP